LNLKTMKMNRLTQNSLKLVLIALPMLSVISAFAQTYSQSSGTVTKTDQTYSTSTIDESAVKVTGGTLTMSNCTITKSGAASDMDNSNFYGLNAAVLNYGSSSAINMTGGTITTSGAGANAFYSYAGASTISDVTISCTANSSRGLFATGGGSITASNVTATTAGSNSSVIATDRGGGTINVTGGTYNCTGTDAAVMYSTGTISVSGITGKSSKGEVGVIEGSNSITISGTSDLTSDASNRGIMVLQSGSGDATGSTGTFTMTGGTLTTTGSSTPLVEVVTNATGKIYLNSVTTSVASKILMLVDYNTRWTTHAATGDLYLNGSYTYTGDIQADSYSKANTSILTGATLVGSINNANTALLTTLTMDASSSWTLTGNSYINGLITDPGISGTSVSNITGNGYNVYYKTSTNTALGGSTYTLQGGGYLLPEGSSGIESLASGLSSFELFQNFPNPVSGSTTISYYLPQNGQIVLAVYNILGNQVDCLVNGAAAEGKHEVEWNPELPQGVYYCRLWYNGNTKTKKMILSN
jgi:hypothetical protein